MKKPGRLRPAAMLSLVVMLTAVHTSSYFLSFLFFLLLHANIFQQASLTDFLRFLWDLLEGSKRGIK